MSKRARDLGADVVLLCLPFGDLRYPSLALSVLKPCLARQGIRTKVRYLTFPFAEIAGADLYTQICASSVCAQVGEWVFSGALFDRVI